MRGMGASFRVEAGPFRMDVNLDDAGIRMERTGLGPAHNVTISWEQITGATLVPPEPGDSDQKEEQMAQFLGPGAVAKYHELKGKVGQICLAYHDEKGRL